LGFGTGNCAESCGNGTDKVIVFAIIFIVDFKSYLLADFKYVVKGEGFGEVRVEVIIYGLGFPEVAFGEVGVGFEEDFDIRVGFGEDVHVEEVSGC
jgi:hypothetical protein